MLDKLKELLTSSFGASEDEPKASVEEQLQMASAILLLEVASRDNEVTRPEVEHIKSVIKAKFSLSNEAAQALMDEADLAIGDVIDFHQFTSALNEHFAIEQKCRLIEYMWLIALSDGHLDGYEDQFIRKIADLLYLRHAELLSARERAKNTLKDHSS